MIRRRTIRAIRGATVLYSCWLLASGLTVALWAWALSAIDAWFAQAGLTLILLLLLVAGIALVARGGRDLVRDLRHHFSLHSDRNGSS